MAAIVPRLLVLFALAPYLAPAVSWCCFDHVQAAVATPATKPCCNHEEPARTPTPSVQCCCEHDPLVLQSGIEVHTVHAVVLWTCTAEQADAKTPCPDFSTQLAAEIPHRILHCVWRC